MESFRLLNFILKKFENYFTLQINKKNETFNLFIVNDLNSFILQLFSNINDTDGIFDCKL